jgi:hypothetical protein
MFEILSKTDERGKWDYAPHMMASQSAQFEVSKPPSLQHMQARGRRHENYSSHIEPLES